MPHIVDALPAWLWAVDTNSVLTALTGRELPVLDASLGELVTRLSRDPVWIDAHHSALGGASVRFELAVGERRFNCGPMNKNRIEGRRDRASWHHTAKPFGWVSEVNAAVVRGRTASLPGETCPVRAGQESAEAIVVGREPGAGTCPFKRRNRKSRSHEGLNR